MPKTMLIDIQTFSSLYYHVQTLPEECYKVTWTAAVVRWWKFWNYCAYWLPCSAEGEWSQIPANQRSI